jgi:hypothetical protein
MSEYVKERLSLSTEFKRSIYSLLMEEKRIKKIIVHVIIKSSPL